MNLSTGMAGYRRWLVLAVVSSALLLIVIDMTVLYTALPLLTEALAASASEKLWIINIYSLVCAGLLLGMGTLGDRVGHRRLFIWGLLVFGLASLAAACSTSSAMLIAARAVLAIGAAMMMPATLSIIRLTFDDEREQAFAIGVWAAVASGGAALGPVVGGVLLEHFWWGSVFLINVPVVLLALLLTLRYVPESVVRSARQWDVFGSLQVMVCLIGFAYAIKEAGKREPSFEAALAALLIGGVFAVLFVRRQRKRADPLIDFAIFRNRSFSCAVAAAVIAAATLIGMELVFTQRLQLVLGLSPLDAALFILPLPLAAFVAGPLAGHVLPRLGAKTVLSVGMLLSAIGMGLYLAVHDAGNVLQMVVLALLGVGLGATFTAASSTIMSSVPAEQAGMAASIEEVCYEFGGAVGVALLGSVLSVVYTAAMTMQRLAVEATVLDSLDEALLAARHLQPEQAQALVQAAKGAFDGAFLVVMAVCAGLLLLGALLVRRFAVERKRLAG